MSQLRQLIAAGLLSAVLAVSVFCLVDTDVTSLLVWLLIVSLSLWVGGAVSGQVLLARLLDEDSDGYDVRVYLSLLLWVIPRFYVPLGVVAVVAGVALVVRQGESFWQVNVVVPLVCYAVLSVAGALVSAPGYRRILRDADGLFGDSDAGRLRTRLLPLAWLNRAELAIVLGVASVLISQFA